MEELPLAFAARDVFAGDGPYTTTEINVEFLIKNIVASIYPHLPTASIT